MLSKLAIYRTKNRNLVKSKEELFQTQIFLGKYKSTIGLNLIISFDTSVTTNPPIGELNKINYTFILLKNILEKIMKNTWRVTKIVKVAFTSIMLDLVKQYLYILIIKLYLVTLLYLFY